MLTVAKTNLADRCLQVIKRRRYKTAFNTAKQVVTRRLYCRLSSRTFFSSPSVEGRRGHTLCPLLYFHHPRAFFPRVVNTNPSRPPAPRLKKKEKGNSVSLRTALRISARTWKWRGLFCFVHFSQITEKICLLCLFTLPCAFWSKHGIAHRLQPSPSPTAVTVCFPNRYLLLVVDFFFFFFAFQGALRREICSHCIYKTVLEGISSYLPRKCLAGRKSCRSRNLKDVLEKKCRRLWIRWKRWEEGGRPDSQLTKLATGLEQCVL